MLWVRAWDFASDEQFGADWTVGTLMGYDLTEEVNTRKVYIANVVRGQWSPETVEEVLLKTAKQDGSHVEILLEQEPGSAGKIVVDQFKRKLLRGYYVTIERPTGPKHIRANLFYAAAERGEIILVRGPWNKTLLDELEDFPSGDHDDQVDTCAYGYNRLCGPRPLGPSWSSRTSRVENVAELQSNEIVTGATWGQRLGGRINV